MTDLQWVTKRSCVPFHPVSAIGYIITQYWKPELNIDTTRVYSYLPFYPVSLFL